jgi:hypothetical protein
LTLRSSPTVFSQPKISSTRFRLRWLIAYPGCRVVRPSIALERLLVFCAMCAEMRVSRSALTKSDSS